MMALASLQAAFQRYVLDADVQIAEELASAAHVDPARRLKIYFDAYRLRLIEALGTDYEALRSLMGAEKFNEACRAYIQATPSSYRNVRWYGGRLAEFLRETAPWSEQPALGDLAQFEWTLTLAFDAPDEPVLTFEALAALPGEAWPALRFGLHPSLHIIELTSNAPALRKASDAAEPLPELVYTQTPTAWLIWRKDMVTCYRSLSEHEAWALRAVREGADFTALCEGLCEWVEAEQAAPQAAGMLRLWVEDGLLGSVNAEE